MNFDSSSGVIGIGASPIVASFSFTSADASAFAVAAYSLSTIGFGVPAGAAIANHAVMS